MPKHELEFVVETWNGAPERAVTNLMGVPVNGLVIGGAILALLGLVGLAIPVLTTHETKEVARIGDLKLQTTEDRSFVVPPLASGGALVIGVILIGAGFYRKR